jgi:quercetin dioxygenase-like cupin family protein
MRAAAALIAVALMAIGLSASAQPALPTRTRLATLSIKTPKLVSRVESTRVDFLPGQAMPTHKHTVPVICFVTQGEFLVSIGTEPERRAALGAVTYEPPEVVVHYFRNASQTAPAQLQCAALAGDDDHTLNVMLPQ